MKKLFLLLLSIILLFSCGKSTSDVSPDIVAIDFPSYDAARAVLGNSENLILLLPPGSESHHYEPTPKDMIAISNAKLVIYTGGESDSWVDTILSSLDKEVPTFKLVDQVQILEEENKEGMTISEHEHNHEKEIDEHVWTSPLNEIKIIKGLVSKLSTIYNDSSKTFESNGNEYIKQLQDIDREIREIISTSKYKELIFASRFPFRYFTEEYGLDYYAAFPGCAEETEPSASTIAFLIDRLRISGLRYVLDIEFGSPLIASTIAEEADVGVLELNSMHNITPERLANGDNYISIMKENIEVLKEVLN